MPHFSKPELWDQVKFSGQNLKVVVACFVINIINLPYFYLVTGLNHIDSLEPPSQFEQY